MKQKLLFGLIVMLFCSSFAVAQSRTGINTTTPRKTLEVNGSVKITNNIDIGTINDVATGDTYTFLVQEPTKKIRALDAATATPGNALGYFIKYRVKYVQGDWVADLNTNINATKFTVFVISSRFTNVSGDPDIKIVTANGFSPAMVTAFVSGGKWHLKADYPGIATYTNQSGLWNIKLLVISKDLIKNLPAQTFAMGNSSTGAATTPVLN